MKLLSAYSSSASSWPKCSSWYPMLLFPELQLRIQLYEPDSQIQFWVRLRHCSIAGSMADSVQRGNKKGIVCIKNKVHECPCGNSTEVRQRFFRGSSTVVWNCNQSIMLVRWSPRVLYVVRACS
jgi:hypothetical protein